MLECGLTYRALEKEDLIRKIQGIAVIEIDLQLRRSALMADRVDVDLLGFAIVVDILDYGIKVICRVDTIGLTNLFGSSAGPNRSFERIIGIKVLLDEIELKFRCNDRLPALSA